MEKADNVYVRCGDFGWSDVGTWGSVYQHSRKDRYANAVPEQGCYLYDTRSSIVSLPKDKVAVISGLKEYIVVDTDDVLMICPPLRGAEHQEIHRRSQNSTTETNIWIPDQICRRRTTPSRRRLRPSSIYFSPAMSELYDLFLKYPRISTDTRKIEPDSIFFALRGPTSTATASSRRRSEKGAAFAVSDDPMRRLADERILYAGDTLQALQELAREHRRALGIPISPSRAAAAKTTTKELVSRVLGERFAVCATRGNLNNHIGVPLTLLSMTRDTEFGVVEMGASACGELALLTSVAEPGYGILTNIGRAHLAGFGGPEGIRRGKGESCSTISPRTAAAPSCRPTTGC